MIIKCEIKSVRRDNYKDENLKSKILKLIKKKLISPVKYEKIGLKN